MAPSTDRPPIITRRATATPNRTVPEDGPFAASPTAGSCLFPNPYSLKWRVAQRSWSSSVGTFDSNPDPRKCHAARARVDPHRHHLTSPFRTVKWAPQLAFSQIEGTSVGRRNKSTLIFHRSFPASGNSTCSPHFGHNKCTHFKCLPRISTASRCDRSSLSRGVSDTSCARSRGLRMKGRWKMRSTRASGRQSISFDLKTESCPRDRRIFVGHKAHNQVSACRPERCLRP